MLRPFSAFLLAGCCAAAAARAAAFASPADRYRPPSDGSQRLRSTQPTSDVGDLWRTVQALQVQVDLQGKMIATLAANSDSPKHTDDEASAGYGRPD